MGVLARNQSLAELRVANGVIGLGFPYKGDGLGPRIQFATGWDPAVFGKASIDHLAVAAEVDEVLAKFVVADRLPDLPDDHMFHLLSCPVLHPTVFDDIRSRARLALRIHFEDPSSATAHRISSDVVQHNRCQVIRPLDGETELEIGTIDSFDPGIEPEVGLVREGEEDEEFDQ